MCSQQALEPCTCSSSHSTPLCRVSAVRRALQDSEYWGEADEEGEDPELWEEEQDGEEQEDEVAALDQLAEVKSGLGDHLAEEELGKALDQVKARTTAQARTHP